MAPGALELPAHESGLVAPLLRGERSHEPEEGASVAAVPLQIGPEDALGVRGPPLAQQRAAEGLADGEVPGGRLVIGHAVLELDGPTKQLDLGLRVAARSGD